MTPANAPLSVEGRRRLTERCTTRPIAHVAAEMGISRACASKWVNRWRRQDTERLGCRPVFDTTPATDRDRCRCCGPSWTSSRLTVRRLITTPTSLSSLNRRRFIDPDGESNRKPRVIVAKRPGHMIHVDVKKVGRIPDGADGGGWRAHGRGSDQARAAARSKGKSKADDLAKGGGRGYVYPHSAVDGHTRMADTEPLEIAYTPTNSSWLNRIEAQFTALRYFAPEPTTPPTRPRAA